MTYTDYVKSLFDSNWWTTPEAKWVSSKRSGKELAGRLGIPVARMLGPAGPCVIKPDRGWGGQGVELIRDPGKWIIEEIVTDKDGQAPPRDFRWYVFHGKAVIVEVCRHARPETVRGLTECRYYWVSDYNRADIDHVHSVINQGEKPMDLDRSTLAEMKEVAEKVASQFQQLKAVRIDLYCSSAGILFSELCASPGLVMGKWIRPEWDLHLGTLIEQGMDAPCAGEASQSGGKVRQERQTDPNPIRTVSEMVFTTDWVTSKIDWWHRIFEGRKGTPLNMLEVGFYEGRSAVWFLTHLLTHPDSRLTSVEHSLNQGWANAAHLKADPVHGPKFTIIEGDSLEQSIDVFPRRQRKPGPDAPPAARYDVIYIDAGKEAVHILTMACLLWHSLRPGGIMLFDDYFWKPTEELQGKSWLPKVLPKVGIDAFLATHAPWIA
ncbi:MAG TPA: class I SAM-dependent methyltransferase, partial [Bacteroidia bacterium]|nr:class I SAM-dependent methyltransferase [Bacteroidia bacterium]